MGLTIALLGWGLVYAWLAGKIGWPEAYGFQCRGRGCFWVELAETPRLLRAATLYELLLFAWIWFMPAATAIAIMFVRATRRGSPHG